MEHITVRHILEATGGQLLCGNLELPIEHLSIDSRMMKGGDLFVPLIGKKADAHHFIEGAFAAGAVATFTSRHEAEDVRDGVHTWIRVADTKKALQDVGAYYRQRLRLPLIGVTGSVGKTTTREMVAAALSADRRVYKTPANHNSQVGVPLTLLGISDADAIGVLELGMSEPGEMAVIARVAQVDVAVITNIGVTHMEQLGSQEAIYREKMSIQEGLRDGGILFLNGDDGYLRDTAARPGCWTVYYGTGEHCQYYAKDIRMEQGYPVFTAVCAGTELAVRLAVMGRHNVLNAMAALAVADTFQVPLALAAAKLAEFDGFEKRQQIYQVDGVTVIDDTYNASPVSMKAGIDVLASLDTGGRRIAVLADMKELGEQEVAYHWDVGAHLAYGKVDVLFTLGELAEEIAVGMAAAAINGMAAGVAGEVFMYREEGRSDLAGHLVEILKPGDCVLLKGSNSMKLSEVVSAIRASYGQSKEQGQSKDTPEALA